MKTTYTPDHVESLKENEIFVFGSTYGGRHVGGAAKLATERFGAIMGQGVGMQGQCYAIPTMSKQRDITQIAPYIADFVKYAKEHSSNVFLVTKIGCGKAGFEVSQIAPLFADAYLLENVILPKEFCDILCSMFPDDKNEPAGHAIADPIISESPALSSNSDIPFVVKAQDNLPPESIELESSSQEDKEPFEVEMPTMGLKVVGKIDVSKYERKKKEIKANRRNIYIIDTNVFVECPNIISKIGSQYEVVLSAKVVDELDKLKMTLNDEGKLNAQKALRMINTTIGKREIRMEYANPALLPEDFNKKSPDNMILSVALKFKAENPIMLTSDNGLQVKAKMLDISTISLKEFLQY